MLRNSVNVLFFNKLLMSAFLLRFKPNYIEKYVATPSFCGFLKPLQRFTSLAKTASGPSCFVRGVRAAFFFLAVFRVSHEGRSERGTTRGVRVSPTWGKKPSYLMGTVLN